MGVNRRVCFAPFLQLGGSIESSERCHPPYGRLRDECLNETLFLGLGHARVLLSVWRDDHNHVRLHGALRGLKPAKTAELARGMNDEHNTNPKVQP